MKKNIERKKIGEISEEDVGKIVIVEGIIESVYPIKEDRLKYYILVDSTRPLQRALYLQMNTTSRQYIIGDGYATMPLIHAPLSFYEGQKIRVMAKVVKYRKRIALKFKKII